MEYLTETLTNGNKINYKRLENGTCYHAETSDKVIEALENARVNRLRVRVWYGKDGKSWNEENDILGYIGRSTGNIKIPLLVYNRRSFGGGGLLDDCIVKIVDTKTGRTLYKHENFSQSFFEADDTLVYQCEKEGQKADAVIWANCETWEQAKRFADFMNGKRHSK